MGELDLPKVDFDDQDEKKSRCCCTSTRSRLLLIIFGTLFIICGAVAMPLLYDFMMKKIVYGMMSLSPSSPIYPEWVNASVDMTSKFYFFEIVNPDEILTGAKPALREKGPYTYKLKVLRANVTSNPNGTISSVPVYQYYFAPELSVGPESDSFLAVNMPMTSTAYMMRDENMFIRRAMSDVLDILGENMFRNLTVADLLWGYDEPLFKLISKFYPMPGGVTDKFGFLLGMNDSDINGVFTVYDGVKDKSMLNRIDRWQGMSNLTYWFTPEANMMNGTDGMMWHPFIKEGEPLPLFHQDFCKSMPYVYEADEMFKGIPLKKYYLPKFAYDNGTLYPPNAGFCDKDTCAPYGMQRMDPCRYGSPMGMSNPHLLYADPALSDQIIGLKPDENKHKNYFLLEPKMAMPYVMRQRLQINMYIKKVDGIKQMGDVRTMYLPTLWFSQEVDVPDHVIDSYKTGFQLTALIVEIIKYTMIVIGGLMVLPTTVALVMACFRRKQDSSVGERKPLLSESSSTTQAKLKPMAASSDGSSDVLSS